MTPQQITLVQATFADVKPIATAAAELFYNRLFTLDPALRPLFKGEMGQQGQMLMSMIGAAVSGLKDLERLAPWCASWARAMCAMACRHSTTPPWAARCCGHWTRAWVTSSRPRCARPGRRPTHCCLT